MAINRDLLPNPDDCGYSLAETGSVLTVTMHKRFDSLHRVDRWAQRLVNAAPPPYDEVRIDLAGFTLISSTIIAGLVYLYDHYANQGPGRIVLVNAGERVHHCLQMTRLDSFFTFA